jgi:hypothetical protein
MFDDKTLDIILEEGASLSMSLKLDSETEVCTEHPITGEPTNCYIQTTPTDISGGNFKGDIVVKFGSNSIASFTLTKQTGNIGVVIMNITKEQVQDIAELVRDEASLNKNSRLRNVGFYDVTYTTQGRTTRIMEGRVTMSLGS